MSEENKTPTTATQWAKAVTEAAKKLPSDERDRITSVYRQTWSLVVLYEAGLARPTPNAASRLQALCEVMLRRAYELSHASAEEVSQIVADNLDTPDHHFYASENAIGEWVLIRDPKGPGEPVEVGTVGSVGDPVWAIREAVDSYLRLRRNVTAG